MKNWFPNRWQQLVAYGLLTIAFVGGLRYLDVRDNQDAAAARQLFYQEAIDGCERVNVLRRIVYRHLSESAELVDSVVPNDPSYSKSQRDSLAIMRSSLYRLPDGSINCRAAIPKPR